MNLSLQMDSLFKNYFGNSKFHQDKNVTDIFIAKLRGLLETIFNLRPLLTSDISSSDIIKIEEVNKKFVTIAFAKMCENHAFRIDYSKVLNSNIEIYIKHAKPCLTRHVSCPRCTGNALTLIPSISLKQYISRIGLKTAKCENCNLPSDEEKCNSHFDKSDKDKDLSWPVIQDVFGLFNGDLPNREHKKLSPIQEIRISGDDLTEHVRNLEIDMDTLPHGSVPNPNYREAYTTRRANIKSVKRRLFCDTPSDMKRLKLLTNNSDLHHRLYEY